MHPFTSSPFVKGKDKEANITERKKDGNKQTKKKKKKEGNKGRNIAKINNTKTMPCRNLCSLLMLTYAAGNTVIMTHNESRLIHIAHISIMFYVNPVINSFNTNLRQIVHREGIVSIGCQYQMYIDLCSLGPKCIIH